MSSHDKDEEVANFKRVLNSLMATLGRITTERELRKAYREESGVNVNVTLDAFGGETFYNFLRFQCRDICDVYTNDGDVRVLRLSTENYGSAEDLAKPQRKKKQKKNFAPKLNFGRTGIITESSLHRHNPQGFNKGKQLNKITQSLTNLSFHRPNLSAVYLPAVKLASYYQQDENDVFDVSSRASAENFHMRSYVDALKLEKKAQVPLKQLEPPRVQNPFDFPSLPKKSDSSGADPEESFEESGEEVEEQEPPAEPLVRISESLEKLELEEPRSITRLELDDQIFRVFFPDVVTDPNFVVPSPKFQRFANELALEVRLTVIYSPSQFYFQYDVTSLDTLMSSLEGFYSTLLDDELVMSDVTMGEPGLMVAAKHFNIWHRAQVISEPDIFGKVRLFFVDYGTQDSVDVTDVRYLLERFAVVTAKALRGSMVGVEPKDDLVTWDFFARNAFFNAVADKKLFASIVSLRDGVYEMNLSENASMSRLISTLLILQRYAYPGDTKTEHNDQFASLLPIADIWP